MDNKLLSQEVINELDKDMQTHSSEERNQLIDWLMANQLTKDKKTIALIESWENSPSALQRRIFWYYQARLRWMGQTPPGNTEELLAAIESNIAGEQPEVQWAMNFTAAWIGVYEKSIASVVLLLVKQRGSTKARWYPRDVRPTIYPSLLLLKPLNGICKMVKCVCLKYDHLMFLPDTSGAASF
ncbi:DNA alkylation repair protein [Niabella hibiscisoli]|uniref:hypothetical protein n=1 Tax=Niabella hibiscisoli TaxID=1825928 RepID=UPI001F0FA1D3|nr:hypothetical protein [Niabella hibiscisoli]MCH5715521.1 hypothetical protein [Niabella hibiscisoli]